MLLEPLFEIAVDEALDQLVDHRLDVATAELQESLAELVSDDAPAPLAFSIPADVDVMF
ncbi:hypothetical protein [Natronorubrum sp. FCH18a]|uniref:hypothetical protein n=1 Tax=Natronorubrum sp. FCH18a TaxID=3447018 RepID=UPI003F515D72